MAKAKTLTSDQKKALDEADSILARALKEAAGKVRAFHPPDDNNDDFGHCLRCCGLGVCASGVRC